MQQEESYLLSIGDLQLSPLSAQGARPKIVALETDKSIPHIQPASNYHSGCQRLPRPRHLVRAPDGPPRRRAVSFHSTARTAGTCDARHRRHAAATGAEIGFDDLTLDKDAGKTTLQRKLLIWRLKPIEASLSDVSDVTVDTAVDRASGVEVCHTMLVRRTGEAWALPAADKKDAEINASAIRDFLARQT
jgi:hypothetical protein